MSFDVDYETRLEIKNLLDMGRYPEGYALVKDIVDARILNEPDPTVCRDLKRLSNWLGVAARVNANDGYFYSHFVRGSTIEIGENLGVPITEALFQEVSDNLAKDILGGIVDDGFIPPVWDVISKDIAAANVGLGLPRWAWAGTLGDHWIPISFGGLGEDFSAIPDESYWGDLGNAVYANLIGGGSRVAGYYISPLVSSYSELAQIIRDLFDPLALDLDGNGISTISANEGITFDHNGSGIKYGTGWINPSDGWLALDRNGNGTIDSGRELFGDSTRKLDGNFAAHAYDALASFDTNKDGKVDVADAAGDTDGDGVIEAGETFWDINNNGVYNADKDKTFADLRVWVDANSNAVVDGCEPPESSSCELKTLGSLNITSIATGTSAGSGVDANGNVNTFKGNYTTTTTATGGVVHTDGTRSFNLVENKFYSENSDNINIPPDVAALPNMQGSGAVRNLHEAMSLGTAESLALKATVQAFSSATIGAFWKGLAANDSFYSERQLGLQNL